MKSTFAALCVVLPCVFLSSCVERLLKIRTNPEGAEVWVNGELVRVKNKDDKSPPTLAGKTPIDVPFDFHGTFDIEVRVDRYTSERRLVEISAPWYAFPPVDLLVEVLLPVPIKEHHLIEFELKPVPDFNTVSKGIAERQKALKAKLYPSTDSAPNLEREDDI